MQCLVPHSNQSLSRGLPPVTQIHKANRRVNEKIQTFTAKHLLEMLCLSPYIDESLYGKKTLYRDRLSTTLISLISFKVPGNCERYVETLNKMKILVTGATGFVGSFLLEKLTELGVAEIIAHYHSSLKTPVKKGIDGQVSWVRADIISDQLDALVSGVDVVYHLAAYSSVEESEAANQMLHNINVEGTRRLAEASRRAGVRHFVFVSSVAACEMGKHPEINEENGFPVTPYGLSKRSAEEILFSMSSDGFEVTVLRPSALFGEDHLGSVCELAKVICQGRFVIFGRGENRTNFYYIRDFIEVLAGVLDNKKAFGQIFIASDEPLPLHELSSLIADRAGYKRFIPKVPVFIGYIIASVFDLLSIVLGKSLPLSKRRLNAMKRDVVYSNKKLGKVLGITPKFGVREGLKVSIAWYRQTGQL